MIKGLSFKVSQFDTDILYQIFRDINIKKYTWHIVNNQTEVWDISHDNFFAQECYSGNSFSQLIKEDHHILFLKLQASLSNISYNITTYEMFQNSDCQILVLVYDCEFFEIYVKDSSILESIFNRVSFLKYNDLKYITNENDDRTTMDIM